MWTYSASPTLRKAVEGKEDTLTEAEARTILEDALRVLFYRDARSINQVLYCVTLTHRPWRSSCSSVLHVVSNSKENCEWRGNLGFVEARDSLELCRGLGGYGAQTQ